MDSESVSSNSINSGDIVSGNSIDSGNYTDTGGARRHLFSEIFYHFFNLNHEESSIFLLCVLLMTSGLIYLFTDLLAGSFISL